MKFTFKNIIIYINLYQWYFVLFLFVITSIKRQKPIIKLYCKKQYAADICFDADAWQNTTDSSHINFHDIQLWTLRAIMDAYCKRFSW